MLTIAIVDDDPGLRRALERLLSAFGWRIETFESYEKFLLAAPTSKVDCIVVDINLGDTAGLALCASFLKSEVSNFRVIFISDVENETVVRRASELGCIAFLRKPVPAHLLIELWRKLEDFP
jgi:FixJ family two-component response regulator